MGPTFPNGVVGIAFLLLRMQAALAALQLALAVGPSIPWSFFVIGIAMVGLVLGLFTRAAALACGVMMLADFMIVAPSLPVAERALGTLVVALVGAGAYSIDGLLFGRREIRFRP
jgi:hypothetical protein